MEKTTILIINENVPFRAQVRKVLSQQSNFHLVDYDLSEDPMTIIDANYPDVVLLGADTADFDSVALSREIVRYYPNTRVIVMSPKPNDNELFEFIKTSAVAYLDKKTTAEEICITIRRSCRGDYPINENVVTRPIIAQLILKQFGEIDSMGSDAERIAAPLTHLEKLILTLVTNCITKKQIARTLRVNERAIENHVSAILRKLINYDRAHSIALSMQEDLILKER